MEDFNEEIVSNTWGLWKRIIKYLLGHKKILIILLTVNIAVENRCSFQPCKKYAVDIL